MKKTLFFSPSCSDFLLYMGTKIIKHIKWAYYDPTHNSMAEDGIPRYGLMSIHPDLIGKSKTQFDWRLDVVESSYGGKHI